MNYLELTAPPATGLILHTDKEQDLERIRQVIEAQAYHGWPTAAALPAGNAWIIWPDTPELDAAAAAAGVPADRIEGHAVTWLNRQRMDAFTAFAVPAAIERNFRLDGPWAATPWDGHGFFGSIDDLTTVISAVCAPMQSQGPAR